MGVFYSLACRTKKLFEPCDQILELMRGRLSGAISGEHVVFTVKTHIFDATIQYLKLRKFRFWAR